MFFHLYPSVEAQGEIVSEIVAGLFTDLPSLSIISLFLQVWNLVSNWFLLHSSSMTNQKVPTPLHASQMCEGTVLLGDASALPGGAVYGQLPPK